MHLVIGFNCWYCFLFNVIALHKGRSSTKLPKYPFEKVQAEYVLDAAPSLSLGKYCN